MNSAVISKPRAGETLIKIKYIQFLFLSRLWQAAPNVGHRVSLDEVVIQNPGELRKRCYSVERHHEKNRTNFKFLSHRFIFFVENYL